MNPYFFGSPLIWIKLDEALGGFRVSLLGLKPLPISADGLRFKLRMWMIHLGGHFVSLGHTMQHAAHLPFHVSHASWKTVSMHSVKVRRHKG